MEVRGCLVGLIGGLRIERPDAVHTRFRSQKTAEVLAILAFNLGRPVPREDFVASLWPEGTSEQARNSLSQAVSSLRHQLEPVEAVSGSVLEASRHSLCLREEGCTTDLAEFRRFSKVAKVARDQGDQERFMEAGARAASLAVGELLPGHSSFWAVSAREAFREEAVALLENLAEAETAARRHTEALGWTLQAVGLDPAREETRQQAIRTFDALGRPEAVLRQYRQLAALLKVEYGERPAPETKALAQAALDKAPARPAEKLPGVAPSSKIAGLATRAPVPTTRYFGRAKDLERISQWFADGTRLVTITGPGGIGKTRFTLELAKDWGSEARFVPLADVRDKSGVWPAIASSLGVRPRPDESAESAVLAFLQDSPGLLILDNYEQLVESEEGAAVASLLEAAPGTLILVSTRRRLEIEGERVLELPPLEQPSPEANWKEARDAPGVALFLDRCRSVRPDFELTEGNAPAVLELCRLLEGIPLALELAASRINSLSVIQIVKRIDQRIDLLASRTKSERHRSLRAAVDWTYELLSPDLKEAFLALTVFRGGFALDQAEAVLESPIATDLVAELRDYSILTGSDEADGSVRFGMLETIREFGLDLATADQTRQARGLHLATFVAFAEAAMPKLSGPDQTNALDELERERENIAAAMEHAVETVETELALRLGAASWRFWHLRSHLAEGRAWLDRALALGGDGAVRAHALNGAGRLAYLQGDYLRSEALHIEAAALAGGDAEAAALAANGLGAVCYELGRYEEAEALFKDALEKRRAMGDLFGAGNALSWLGILWTDQGRHAEAREALEESLSVRRKIGDTGGIARSLNSLGIVARQTGDLAGSEALYREALALHRQIGDQRAEAGILSNLSMVALVLGRTSEAATMWEEALAIHRQIGDRWGIATVTANLGNLALKVNDLAQAAQLHSDALRRRLEMANLTGIALSLEGSGETLAALEKWGPATEALAAAQRLREEVGSPPAPSDKERLDAVLALCADRLDEEAIQRALALGRSRSVETACHVALSELA